MGINQLLAAARNPPGLKAIFPIVPAGDIYRDVVWHGGQVDAGFIPLWIGLVGVAGLAPPQDPAGALQWLLARLTTSGKFPARAITQGLLGGDLAYDGAFYRVRSPLERIDRIDVPTFVVGGWWDLFQRSEPTIYRRLRMAPGRKQLLMGPWYHATPFVGGESGLGAGPNSPQELEDLEILWFDRWLKGNRNGIDDPDRYGPVTLSQLGARNWRREERWPLPTRQRRLYLSAQPSGSASTGADDGSLGFDRPAREGTKLVRQNLLAGLCARTAVQWTAGLVAATGEGCENGNAQAERGAATFTTAPFAQATHLSGPISVHLRGSTNAGDGFWVAELTDVAPGGQSSQITTGFLQMSRRALDRSRSQRASNGDLAVPFHPFTRESLLPVTPGRPESLDIEVFNTNVVLARGHRLRLVLRSSDIPHALPTVPELPNFLAATRQTVHIRAPTRASSRCRSSTARSRARACRGGSRSAGAGSGRRGSAGRWPRSPAATGSRAGPAPRPGSASRAAAASSSARAAAGSCSSPRRRAATRRARRRREGARAASGEPGASPATCCSPATTAGRGA
jgi:putative CocE/NonD family hydrolase